MSYELIVWHNHAEVARYPADAQSRVEGSPGQEDLVVVQGALELARYPAGSWSAAAHDDPATKRCAGPPNTPCPVCNPPPAVATVP